MKKLSKRERSLLNEAMRLLDEAHGTTGGQDYSGMTSDELAT